MTEPARAAAAAGPPPGLPSTMLGAVLLGPERIEIRELPLPLPGPGELLLRIGAATTCGTDVKVFRRGGHPRMLRVPALFGHEMAGTVAAAGSGAPFAAGARLVVANSASCGACERCRRGRENLCEDLVYLNGAFAEYILVPERFARRSAVPLPAGLAFERAALAEPLACVLHGVDACGLPPRDAQWESIDTIVYGAGPIGLFFVAALTRAGARVVLADPNPTRLATGSRLGAAATIAIERGGGQADRVRAATRDGRGADVVVDATGVPEVWQDAIASTRPGGLVNLFGGCAPGTTIPLDTCLLHYSEITIKGVYHHRPATVQRAIEMLADPTFAADLLLSGEVPIEDTEAALRAMMRKEALKMVVRGRRG